MMSHITIHPLAAGQTDEAIALLARAFVTNPLHVAAFGSGAVAANETFFRIGLSIMCGSKLVAMQGTRVVGFVHWVDSPRCQVSTAQKLQMFPSLLSGFGLRRTLRVVTWLSAWSNLDPAEPHVHVGPIGVDPAVQGQGVGRHLMEACCAAIDREGLLGALETDRPENVAFYQRFDFSVITTRPVIGVPNYFMHRGAR